MTVVEVAIDSLVVGLCGGRTVKFLVLGDGLAGRDQAASIDGRAVPGPRRTDRDRRLFVRFGCYAISGLLDFATRGLIS